MSTKEITIGQTVISLFAEGFLHENYHFMVSVAEASSSQTEKVLSEILKLKRPTTKYHRITKHQKSKLDSFSKDLEEQKDKVRQKLGAELSETIDEKYLLPPYCPFDLFAITSQLLVGSGAYHHIESGFDSTNAKKTWRSNKVLVIPDEDVEFWNKVGAAWKTGGNFHSVSEIRQNSGAGVGDEDDPSDTMLDYWIRLLQHWNSPVYKLLKGNETTPPEWWNACLALLAISDKAAEEVGFGFSNTSTDWVIFANQIFNQFAKPKSKDPHERSWKFVESISFANRNILNVLPKSSTPHVGCTLRSISINLAKLPPVGNIRVGWSAVERKHDPLNNPMFNILLIPYPYEVHSYNFIPTARYIDRKKNFGNFVLEVESTREEDKEFKRFVIDLIKQTVKQLGVVHAVVLPELAIKRDTAQSLLRLIPRVFPEVEVLCFGLRERMLKNDPEPINSNGALMAYMNNRKVEKQFFHFKHHRWRVDANQIEMYDLAPALDPSHVWWEDIGLTERCLPFVVVRNKWSITALICEDLARTNPAKEVVEAIGPNLIISLLMDGPQIAQRWPSRYATVLADDPGSSVLTITSLGMMRRYNSNCKKLYGFQPSNSVALWRDDTGRSIPIELEKGNHAVAITLNEFPKNICTLYGRIDNRGTSLRLSGVRQISLGKSKTFPSWSSPK